MKNDVIAINAVKKRTKSFELNDLMSTVSLIKEDVLNTRNKIIVDSNKELLYLYFRIGKHISEMQKYGSYFISILSKTLKAEFTHSAGFSPRNLYRMKRFYESYIEFSNLPPAAAKLSWSHNSLLVERIKDLKVRIWYMEKCLENGWSKETLDYQIDLNLFSRQYDNTKKLTNFRKNLNTQQSTLAIDILKDPYIFELSGLTEKSSERDIEKAMIEGIKTILLEFGKGFSFVGNQYLISTQSSDYFIDLLFYHLILRCYVVVELKSTDFDPSFIGQLQFYVTAIDQKLKTEHDNQTIGLLLCKHKDKNAVEWSLKSSIAPIGVASYKIKHYLPPDEIFNKYIK